MGLAGLIAILVALACGGSAAAAPACVDNVQDAQQLAPSTQFVCNTDNDTIQAGEPLTRNGPAVCAQSGLNVRMGHTVWFYVVGNGGRMVISSRNSTRLGSGIFDSILNVYGANVTPPSLIGALCSDDIGDDANDDDVNDALIVLQSTAPGARYYVQAGGCDQFSTPEAPGTFQDCSGAGAGDLHISAVDNDQRAHAEALTSATGDRSNIGASVDANEEQTRCQGTAFGATVWFKYTASKFGTLTFSASRFST